MRATRRVVLFLRQISPLLLGVRSFDLFRVPADTQGLTGLDGAAINEKISVPKIACFVFLLCAATAVSSPAQMFTTLVNFNGANGSGPQSSLVQGADGNFYGTTSGGGAGFGLGEIFKMTPDGTLTVPPFYSFCPQFNGSSCPDGWEPSAPLVRATDGNFYGTTYYGGVGSCSFPGCGTFFKITPSGLLSTLYSFCSQSGCHDGANPTAGLLQASDGNFYGTTPLGGNSGNGTIFKITPSGTLVWVYSFCSQSNCADGAQPYASLVQGTDGNLYGTTTAGGTTSGMLCQNGNGAPGCGTVFKVSLTGPPLIWTYAFCPQQGCADGATPYGGLVQATDGNFYGTTFSGGNVGAGTVFKITPSGMLTSLQSFGYPNGGAPYSWTSASHRR